MMRPFDPRCQRYADEIDEYVLFAAPENGYDDPNQFVIEQEGTYNSVNGHFLCTECYIAEGLPVATSGWKCP